ncbi:MAG: hypothetical protein Q4D06_08520 [Coriobacteriia bacterium]|nr:hypothetical protein [Coriobacteriia bacterium]
MCSAFCAVESNPILPESSVVQASSLQDALAECNWDLLTDVIVDQYVVGLDRLTEFSAPRIRAVQDRIRTALEQMTTQSRYRPYGRERVIVPRETFLLEGSSLCIRRRIDACCVAIQDLEDETFVYDDPQIDFGFAELSWENALAMPVWYLSTFCEQERYMMLASAFWEMTRYGFSWEDHELSLWSRGLPKVADPANGMIVPLGRELETRRPAGFDWGYRQRLRSRVIELNRCAEENFLLTLKGMCAWMRAASAHRGWG